MTFAELMAYSKVEAAQYLIDCWVDSKIMGMDPKEYIKMVKADKWQPVEEKEVKKEVVEKSVEIKEEETPENEELTKEDLHELLDANNIEYKKTLGVKRLMELATERGLL